MVYSLATFVDQDKENLLYTLRAYSIVQTPRDQGNACCIHTFAKKAFHSHTRLMSIIQSDVLEMLFYRVTGKLGKP